MASRKANNPPTSARLEMPDQPVPIHPHNVYTARAARKTLGLGINALRGEVEAGRLRSTRRCNRVWFLGQWLLDWLSSGPVTKDEQVES